MNALLKLVTDYWHSEPAVQVPAQDVPRVGEFKADYSAISPGEIAQNDPQVDELFKHSKQLPR